MKKRIFALCLAGIMAGSALSGCGKKKDDDTSSQISIIESTEGSDLDVEWPDKGEDMAPIIDAMVMAATENPEIKYDLSDNESFWTFIYYILVENGATFNIASEKEDGSYEIIGAAVKIYARAAFNEYNGKDDLPPLPDNFEGIEYNKDTDTYTYKDRGIRLGESEVYACAKNDDGSYSMVSYMIDNSDSQNPVITPWKLSMVDIRTANGSTPLYCFRITAMELVDESAGAEDNTEKAPE